MSVWALFDLDGTLTDSEPGILSCYRQTLASFGVEVDDQLIRKWIGPPLAEAFAAFGVPADRVDQAIENYRAHYAAGGLYESQPCEGVPQMLAELVEAGVTLGVATSKLQSTAAVILEHFHLADRFDVITGASRDGRRRHKVDVLAHALEALGMPDPGRVIFAGDREHDIYAALEHGVVAVGVLWGYGGKDELLAAGAAELVSTPDELTKLVLEFAT